LGSGSHSPHFAPLVCGGTAAWVIRMWIQRVVIFLAGVVVGAGLCVLTVPSWRPDRFVTTPLGLSGIVRTNTRTGESEACAAVPSQGLHCMSLPPPMHDPATER
jgi:hypothetical protein